MAAITIRKLDEATKVRLGSVPPNMDVPWRRRRGDLRSALVMFVAPGISRKGFIVCCAAGVLAGIAQERARRAPA